VELFADEAVVAVGVSAVLLVVTDGDDSGV
jgi:hypothetical protein